MDESALIEQQQEIAVPEMQVDLDGMNHLANRLATGQPQTTNRQVTVRVSHDHMFVYLHVQNNPPIGMTLMVARELALLLRQACNQVEQGK